MDLKTILILTAISNLLIFISLFLFIKLSKEKNRLFDIYAYGKFIQATGWILIILRGLVPDIASIEMANSLIILGFGAEIFAISSYKKKRLKYQAKIFGLITAIFIFFFLILTNFEANIRIAYMSFVFFVWLSIASQQLIGFSRENKLQFAAGIIFGFFAIFPLIRAISVLFVFKTDTLFDTNIIQSIWYSALFLFNFISALLLLLLLKEQDEETIRLSEEKYKKFTEFLPQIVFETNNKGQITYLNEQAFLLTGFSPEDIEKGLNIQDVFVKEDIERALKSLKEMLSGKGQTGTEYLVQKKNGEKFPVLIYSSPIVEDNKVLGLRGIIVDITERKKADQQLKKLSIAVEQSANTIVLTDTEGKIEYTNPRFTEQTGYTAEEVIGQNPNILNAGVQPTEYYKEMWETIAKGNIWKGEFCNKKKNGDLYWEQVTITPIKDDAGEITNYLAIKEDITAKRDAQMALKESEEKFRVIVETASDWIWEIDKTGKYTYSSPRIHSILGYTEKEIIGKTPFDFMPETEKERVSNIFADIIKQNKAIIELENINIHKNGNLVILETSGLPFFDTNGELLGYRGIDRDVTHRNETERALKESEERLRLAQNAGKIGIWEWNVETDQIVWSDMTYKIFGLQKTKEIITSEEYFNHVHPDDKQRIISELDASIKIKKEGHRTEYRIVKNNEIRWIDETSLIITDKTENLVKMIGVLQDITDQKIAQHALKKSEENLRESNKTKDMFFSIIAHDLKSPFNTMLGFSDLLVNDFDNYDIEQQKKFIGVINKGINNTYKLLENLLIWSRAQQGTIDFNPEPENLHLLASETIGLLGQQYTKKSITLINKVPEDIEIIADRNMLLTILRNLISNAIKFTPKKGKIVVNANLLSNKKEQTYTQISVKDNGLGILKDKQEQIFKISETISTKGTEGETGTGLGLVLCREFVEKHGGKIWVESEEGHGSEFIFTLPENT